jgi:phosphoglycerate kinase
LIQGLSSLNPAGKRVLLRCDLNVPLKDNGDGKRVITDDGRIRASLPTIQELLSLGASVVIIAHLGRPKGEVKSELSLEPVAKRLAELLGMQVAFSSQILGPEAFEKAAALKSGEVLLLENIRFNASETSKDETERLALAKELAKLGDLYVGDGFGAVHRKHASVFELAQLLPHAAGKLIAAEVAVLEKLTQSPERPYGVVLGGAKVSDLLDKVNILAIGGGMLFTFLAAQGKEIGKSLFEAESVDLVKQLLERAEKLGVRVLLPSDIWVAPAFANESPSLVSADQIPSNQMGLDIGPESAHAFASAIKECATLFWNGPMGVFEFPNFASGTRIVAQALSEVSGLSVVGGGDSAAAVRALGFSDSDFGYISTGGGASLEYLEGKQLPGLIALR